MTSTALSKHGPWPKQSANRKDWTRKRGRRSDLRQLCMISALCTGNNTEIPSAGIRNWHPSAGRTLSRKGGIRIIKSSNRDAIQQAFTQQAGGFESNRLNFTRQDYLDHIVSVITPLTNDSVLEVAAGTCAAEPSRRMRKMWSVWI